MRWGLRGKGTALPRLWLFTDRSRLIDPRDQVMRLPRGKAGVVMRHDDDPGRAVLGRDLARICRTRRLLLVVAGDTRLAAAVKAGVHLRGGRWPGPVRLRHNRLGPGRVGGMVTGSAHSVPDILRGHRAGARLIFLSPAFATASHAGAAGLGPLRWSAMARCLAGSPVAIAALGGVTGQTVRRLKAPFAVGAIGAFDPGRDDR